MMTFLILKELKHVLYKTGYTILRENPFNVVLKDEIATKGDGKGQ